MFHNNINGLENKHDLLQKLLANNYINFDIIAITETSLKTENINFNSNIGLKDIGIILYLQIARKEVLQSMLREF